MGNVLELTGIGPDTHVLAAADVPRTPWLVSQVEQESEGATVKVKVSKWRPLRLSIAADDTIEVTEADEPFDLPIADEPKPLIWVEVDLRPLYTLPPGKPTAKIGHGSDWNGEDGDFWPGAVRYDTDDGTPKGSTGTPPANAKATHVYCVIAFTMVHVEDDETEPAGAFLSDNVILVQATSTPLMLIKNWCDRGAIGAALIPATHPIPETDA